MTAVTRNQTHYFESSVIPARLLHSHKRY